MLDSTSSNSRCSHNSSRVCKCSSNCNSCCSNSSPTNSSINSNSSIESNFSGSRTRCRSNNSSYLLNQSVLFNIQPTRKPLMECNLPLIYAIWYFLWDLISSLNMFLCTPSHVVWLLFTSYESREVHATVSAKQLLNEFHSRCVLHLLKSSCFLPSQFATTRTVAHCSLSVVTVCAITADFVLYCINEQIL